MTNRGIMIVGIGSIRVISRSENQKSLNQNLRIEKAKAASEAKRTTRATEGAVIMKLFRK